MTTALILKIAGAWLLLCFTIGPVLLWALFWWPTVPRSGTPLTDGEVELLLRRLVEDIDDEQTRVTVTRWLDRHSVLYTAVFWRGPDGP